MKSNENAAMSCRVLISNGGYKFHLASLATEMADGGILGGFLTAGWPSGWQLWLAKKFPNSPAWRRFVDRAEPIPKELVYSVWEADVLLKGADFLVRSWSEQMQQHIHRIGFQTYAKKAAKVVRKVQPDIYHYRNCYGMKSVAAARKCNAIGLCDHSIAHPYFMHWLENHRGQWPSQEDLVSIPASLSPLQKAMATDLKLADHTIVNSDFVKQTCVQAGMAAEKVHAVYWGVDEAFFQMLESTKSTERVTNETVLFAGGWQRRKGVDTLIDSFTKLKVNWKLEIAGGIEPEAKVLPGMEHFFSLPQVDYLGILPRTELAATMKKHRIFVFPSYCEGSARVIFEAMAAGCYVITTYNSGSIVEDGIHGKVVPCGDEKALCAAIEYALANPERVDEIGFSNAQLVAKSYRQIDYGLKVRQLYNFLLAERSGK